MTFVQMIIASVSIYIYLSAFQNCSCYCRSGGAIEPQPRGLAVTARCMFHIGVVELSENLCLALGCSDIAAIGSHCSLARPAL